MIILPYTIQRFCENFYLQGSYFRPIDESQLADYTEILEQLSKWEEGMPFAVSVFGEILAWTKDEYVVLYKPMLNEKHILLKGADFIETYLSDPAIQEEYLEKQLFNDAKELLGEVSGDECYIFELLPIIGGEKTVEHLRIGKTLVYLQIINEFLS